MTELDAAGLQVTPIPDADTRQRTFGVRWLRNGDHPGDALGELLDDPMGGPPYERLEGKVVRFFRSPDYPGEEVHECGHRWHDHGWLDLPDGGETVCPGDWVVIDAAYLREDLQVSGFIDADTRQEVDEDALNEDLDSLEDWESALRSTIRNQVTAGFNVTAQGDLADLLVRAHRWIAAAYLGRTDK